MSFGFSIGDFITIVELATKVRKGFVGAPSQFKDVSTEYVARHTFYRKLLTAYCAESEILPLLSKMSKLYF